MEKTKATFIVAYFVSTLCAFIGGLFVSFLTLFGLAWGGFGSTAFNLAAIFGNLSTLGLLAGLLMISTERKAVVIATMLSAMFAPILIACMYAPALWTRHMHS